MKYGTTPRGGRVVAYEPQDPANTAMTLTVASKATPAKAISRLRVANSVHAAGGAEHAGGNLESRVIGVKQRLREPAQRRALEHAPEPGDVPFPVEHLVQPRLEEQHREERRCEESGDGRSVSVHARATYPCVFVAASLFSLLPGWLAFKA